MYMCAHIYIYIHHMNLFLFSLFLSYLYIEHIYIYRYTLVRPWYILVHPGPPCQGAEKQWPPTHDVAVTLLQTVEIFPWDLSLIY